jgi:transposase
LAAADGLNNAQIVRALGVSRAMVRLWRQRWRDLAAVPLAHLSVSARLEDGPRPGRPARISSQAVCQIVALACELPARSGRPISQWTSRELADEIKSRGILEQISARHAARLLKRGISNPVSAAPGGRRRQTRISPAKWRTCAGSISRPRRWPKPGNG